MDEVGACYIPAHVMAREDLSLAEKVLMGRIIALVGPEGYCWAGNDFLGKNIGLEPNSVSKIVTKLVQKGLLWREVERNENKVVIRRKLYPYLREGDTSWISGGDLPDENAIPPLPKSKESIETSIELDNHIYISDAAKTSKPTTKKSSDPFPDLSVTPVAEEEILHAIPLLDLKQTNTELYDRFIERARLLDRTLSLVGKVKMTPSVYNYRVPVTTYSDKSSVSSLSVCSDEQLWIIARDLGIDVMDVVKKYDIILEMFEAGDFKKRYKHKTTYYTLRNWLRMDRDNGRIDTLDMDSLAELREDSPTSRRKGIILQIKERKKNGLHP